MTVMYPELDALQLDQVHALNVLILTFKIRALVLHPEVQAHTVIHLRLNGHAKLVIPAARLVQVQEILCVLFEIPDTICNPAVQLVNQRKLLLISLTRVQKHASNAMQDATGAQTPVMTHV